MSNRHLTRAFIATVVNAALALSMPGLAIASTIDASQPTVTSHDEPAPTGVAVELPSATEQVTISLDDVMSGIIESGGVAERVNSARISGPNEGQRMAAKAMLEGQLPQGVTPKWSTSRLINGSVFALELIGVGLAKGSTAILQLNSMARERVVTTLIQEPNANQAHVVKIVDGALVSNRLISVANSGPSVQGANEAAACLMTTLGIGAAAAWAIITACGGVCAATAGVGCVICVAAFVVVGGGTLGYCFEKLRH